VVIKVRKIDSNNQVFSTKGRGSFTEQVCLKKDLKRNSLILRVKNLSYGDVILNSKYNWVYIPLTVISITVLILHKVGPYAGQLRHIAFALFTILCLALLMQNKNSKGKIFGAILYFIIGLIVFLY
jgi:hypothetical protein